MVTILRILFGIGCFIVASFLGLFVGTGITRRQNNRQLAISMGYIFNTIMLAIFFTLWSITKGVI